MVLAVAFPCILSAANETNAEYLLRYQSVGWKTEIRLNGVPILKRDKGGGQVPIQNLVVTGSNTIDVCANQLDDDADDCQVQVVSVAALNDKEDVLLDFSQISKKTGTTVTKAFGFEAHAPKRWVWEGALKVDDLNAADKRDIYRQIEELATAFQTKSLKLHNQVRATFISETAESSGVKENEVADSFAQLFKGLFDDKSFEVRKRGVEDLDFEACGRITAVSAKMNWPDDWIISLRAGSRTFAIREMLFCKIGGEWKLIN
jgi:hypothetical protein